jgi:primase-polymerase (primpol)-like protein
MDSVSLAAARERLRASLEEIRDRNGHDEEVDHANADDALLQFARDLGCEYEADIFERLDKWYA